MWVTMDYNSNNIYVNLVARYHNKAKMAENKRLLFKNGEIL